MPFSSRKKLNTAKNSLALIQKRLNSNELTIEENEQLQSYSHDIFLRSRVLIGINKKKTDWYNDTQTKLDAREILEHVDYSNINQFAGLLLQNIQTYIDESLHTPFQELPADKQYLMQLWDLTLLNYALLDAYNNYESYKLGLSAIFLGEVVITSTAALSNYFLGGALLAMMGASAATGGIILIAAIAVLLISLIAIGIAIYSQNSDLKTLIGTASIEKNIIPDETAEDITEPQAKETHVEIIPGTGIKLVLEQFGKSLSNSPQVINPSESFLKIEAQAYVVNQYVSNIKLGM